MDLLHSPIVWSIVAAVAVVVVIAIIRRHVRPEWGFRDLVKNPEHWGRVSEARQKIDSAGRDANNWSDKKVASFTKQFVLEATTSGEAWVESRILKKLDARTHPAVFALLRDPGLYAKLVKPTGKDFLPEAPFNRACDLLGDTPPPEAVEALAPFLDDQSLEIRKDAALLIAKTGAPSITSHLRKAFADPEERVRSYALIGLEFPLSRSGLAGEAAEALYPEVLALLEAGRNADDMAVDILFLLDGERSKEYFLSESVFTADSPILHQVLKTLANARIPVPRERLLKLVAAIEAKELEYPRTYALAEALRLLGQLRQDADRELLRARTTHPDEEVAKGAAAGLLSSYGLEEFEQQIWEAEERSGFESLSEHQRFYRAVSMCDGEINNGGLAQYFVNSSGDQWREAVAGFQAMGFKERLRVLKEATALFGNDGPATDRDRRQEQLSRLYRRNDSIFDELDARYFDSSEVVAVHCNQFVLANPESFR
ncbi:DUF4375 domain-containing protein [Candidatus Sumerlaeota bacterium]